VSDKKEKVGVDTGGGWELGFSKKEVSERVDRGNQGTKGSKENTISAKKNRRKLKRISSWEKSKEKRWSNVNSTEDLVRGEA